MNAALVKEAEALGINTSMYLLIPPRKREDALRADIAQAKQTAKGGEKDGKN